MTKLSQREQQVLCVYTKNTELYKGKSINWHVRITADEAGVSKEYVYDVLAKQEEIENEEKTNGN